MSDHANCEWGAACEHLEPEPSTAERRIEDAMTRIDEVVKRWRDGEDTAENCLRIVLIEANERYSDMVAIDAETAEKIKAELE